MLLCGKLLQIQTTNWNYLFQKIFCWLRMLVYKTLQIPSNFICCLILYPVTIIYFKTVFIHVCIFRENHKVLKNEDEDNSHNISNDCLIVKHHHVCLSYLLVRLIVYKIALLELVGMSRWLVKCHYRYEESIQTKKLFLKWT